jgi:hypothetical protein
MMEYAIFLVMWWFGTLVCLVTSIFALVTPARWLRSHWTTPRMTGLETRPKLVRGIGAIGVVIGVFWAIQGVRLTLGFLRGVR